MMIEVFQKLNLLKTYANIIFKILCKSSNKFSNNSTISNSYCPKDCLKKSAIDVVFQD